MLFRFDPLPLSCAETLSIISENNEVHSPLSTTRSTTVTSPTTEGMPKKTDRISVLKTAEYTQLALDGVDRPTPPSTSRSHRIQSFAKHLPRNIESGGFKLCKHLRVLLPLFLLAVYSGLGGLVFWHLEGTGSEEQLKMTANQRFAEKQNASAMELAEIIEWSNGTLSVDELGFFLREYAERLGLQPADIKERTFWGSVSHPIA